MKNSNPILKALISSQLIIASMCGQTAKSDYLVKPICEYNLSENDEASKVRYNQCEKIYSVGQSLDQVWAFYTTLNTKAAWDPDNAKFLMSYDGNNDTYNTVDSPLFDTLKQNKVFLLELTFLKLVKVPVVFQITKIDHTNKIIQFTYMRENKSNGFQTLEFTEQNGITLIKHSSYYASGSKLRDKYLYPKFHEVATDDFHSNIFGLLALDLEKKRLDTIRTPNNDLTILNVTAQK